MRGRIVTERILNEMDKNLQAHNVTVGRAVFAKKENNWKYVKKPIRWMKEQRADPQDSTFFDLT